MGGRPRKKVAFICPSVELTCPFLVLQLQTSKLSKQFRVKLSSIYFHGHKKVTTYIHTRDCS